MNDSFMKELFRVLKESDIPPEKQRLRVGGIYAKVMLRETNAVIKEAFEEETPGVVQLLKPHLTISDLIRGGVRYLDRDVYYVEEDVLEVLGD